MIIEFDQKKRNSKIYFSLKVVPMMGITYNRYTTEPPEKMTHKVYYTGILKHLIIEVFLKSL